MGWFSLIRNPDYYTQHPDWYVEVSPKDEAYKNFRDLFQLQKESNNIRFCVKRDPVKRFISGFKNRVHTHDECEVKDFDQFVDNFEEIYGTNGSIYTHFKPQSLYYGTDQTIYERIFRTEELDECRQWLSDRFNRQLPNLRLQQNVPVKVDPTNKQIEKIKHFYRADYKNKWY